MKSLGLVLAGVAAGYVLARVLREPSSCCKRVADGVRDRVGEELGSTVQGIGDVIGWDWTPGVLDLVGA